MISGVLNQTSSKCVLHRHVCQLEQRHVSIAVGARTSPSVTQQLQRFTAAGFKPSFIRSTKPSFSVTERSVGPLNATVDEFQVEFEQLSKNLAQNGKQVSERSRPEAARGADVRPAVTTERREPPVIAEDKQPIKPIPVALKVKAVGNNTEDLLNNLLHMINELKTAIEEKDKKILALEKSSKQQQDREIKISALARENAVLLDELKVAQVQQDKNTRLELQVSQCIQLLRQLIDSQERVIPVLKEIIDDQDTKRKV